MTTDKTPATLATVKHGGCVQLGDWLPPLPPEVDSVRCMIHGEQDLAEPCYSYYTAKQMRDYARAALSAQPSPGGQGDACIERAAKALHAHGADNLCNDVLWDDLHQPEADQFRSWARAALVAARQPVGFMSAEASLVARGMVAHCIEHRLCMGMDEGFTSFDPDVEHPFVQELREFVEGSRQPVTCVRDLLPQEVLSAISAVAVTANKESAHPVQKYIDAINAWLYAAPTAQAAGEPVGKVFWDNETGEISVNWIKGDLPPGIGTLLYEASPAQAVDLGAVADVLRELLTERQHRTDGSLMELAERCRHLSRGDRDCIALRGTLITELEAQAVDLGPLRSLARSWIVEAGGTVADTKHACADELLAVTDSQAVGNG